VARALKQLKPYNVTVITNALNIAIELSDAPNISLIMIGGILRQIRALSWGHMPKRFCVNFTPTACFWPSTVSTLDNGPSTPDILEAQLNGLMIEGFERDNSGRPTPANSGRRSLSRIGTVDRVKRLITDTRAPEDFVAALKSANVEVVTV